MDLAYFMGRFVRLARATRWMICLGNRAKMEPRDLGISGMDMIGGRSSVRVTNPEDVCSRVFEHIVLTNIVTLSFEKRSSIV